MSFDKVRLSGITAKGYHGFYDTERVSGQNFVVDVELDVDSPLASVTDQLDDTVNYEQVGKVVTQIIEGSPVRLIETLAERIAVGVLLFQKAIQVKVTVHKPQAPLDYQFDDVSLSIVRNRSSLKMDFDSAGLDRAKILEIVEDIDDSYASRNNNSDEQLLSEDELKRNIEISFAQDDVTVAKSVSVPKRSRGSRRSLRQEKSQDQTASVLLALGANQGSPVELFQEVIAYIDSVSGCQVQNVSPLLLNKAHTLDGDKQDDYYNCVVRIETSFAPLELLAFVKEIEREAGRVEAGKWAPRVLDIDIITYNDYQYNSEQLQIPHPLAHKRIFVLLPWELMEPQAKLNGVSVHDLVSQTGGMQDILHIWSNWLGKTAQELESADNDYAGEDLEPSVRIVEDDVDIYLEDDVQLQDLEDDFVYNSFAEDNLLNQAVAQEVLKEKVVQEVPVPLTAETVSIPEAPFAPDLLQEENLEAENSANSVIYSAEDTIFDVEPLVSGASETETSDKFDTAEHTKVMNQLRTLFDSGVEEELKSNAGNSSDTSLSDIDNSSARANLYEVLRKKSFDEVMSEQVTENKFKPRWIAVQEDLDSPQESSQS